MATRSGERKPPVGKPIVPAEGNSRQTCQNALRYSKLLGVSLTTIAQPYRELAANAMRTMLNRLAGAVPRADRNECQSGLKS
jgi:hypothetical protein